MKDFKLTPKASFVEETLGRMHDAKLFWSLSFKNGKYLAEMNREKQEFETLKEAVFWLGEK